MDSGTIPAAPGGGNTRQHEPERYVLEDEREVCPASNVRGWLCSPECYYGQLRALGCEGLFQCHEPADLREHIPLPSRSRDPAAHGPQLPHHSRNNVLVQRELEWCNHDFTSGPGTAS